jgi:hypothetical protein
MNSLKYQDDIYRSSENWWGLCDNVMLVGTPPALYRDMSVAESVIKGAVNF